jgi:hypothetical protein
MKRLFAKLPSPAMIIAIIALVAALAGTAVAAGTIKLGALTNGAKNKTVGVGKLTYVNGPTVSGQPGGIDLEATATCPTGLEPIGGGVARVTGNAVVRSSHPTPTGWKARVNLGAIDSVHAVVACATSRVVTGAPPS